LARARRGFASRPGCFAKRAAPVSLRHSSWASALVGKFSRSDVSRDFAHESLVTLRAWQRILIGVRERRTFIPVSTMPVTVVHTIAPASSVGTLSHTASPAAAVSPIGSRIVVERIVRLAMTSGVAAFSNDTDQQGSFTPREARFVHRIALPEEDRGHRLGLIRRVRPHVAKELPTSKPVQIERGSPAARPIYIDPAPPDIATRVVRQHRRVEDRLLAQEGVAPTERPMLPVAPVVTLERAPASQKPSKRYEAAPDLEGTSPNSRPPPIVDVVRITDEVMKQLDRRIVATRERIGKM